MSSPADAPGPGDAPPSRAREAGTAGLGRVLHVLSGLPFGGNETLCYQLMTKLSFRERLLLNIGPDGPMREKFEALKGFQLLEIPYQRERRIRFVWQLWLLFLRLRPRGVIIYPFGLHVLVGLAARLACVRRVLVHAGNPVPQDEARRHLWTWIVRASVLLRIPIISCSGYVDREFRRLCRILPARSRAIHNGIDTLAVFERALVARASRKDLRPIVGMIARLSVIKDHETLVRAMASVRLRHPDVRAWIVGEGEMEERLKQVTVELGLKDVVQFLGKRGDVPELLGQMDVYVFSTTRDEGFGIAIAEGMSAGLPVIASDVPACREVLEHGGGILVPPRDVAALAEAISGLLDDREQRERWAARALGTIDSFSVERCAMEWQRSLAGAADA